MMKQFGPKVWNSSDTPPTDPRANALLGAEFIKYNVNGLKNIVGNRPVTDVDFYLSHFMGLGGAKKFLQAPPD